MLLLQTSRKKKVQAAVVLRGRGSWESWELRAPKSLDCPAESLGRETAEAVLKRSAERRTLSLELEDRQACCAVAGTGRGGWQAAPDVWLRFPSREGVAWLLLTVCRPREGNQEEIGTSTRNQHPAPGIFPRALGSRGAPEVTYVRVAATSSSRQQESQDGQSPMEGLDRELRGGQQGFGELSTSGNDISLNGKGGPARQETGSARAEPRRCRYQMPGLAERAPAQPSHGAKFPPRISALLRGGPFPVARGAGLSAHHQTWEAARCSAGFTGSQLKNCAPVLPSPSLDAICLL